MKIHEAIEYLERAFTDYKVSRAMPGLVLTKYRTTENDRTVIDDEVELSLEFVKTLSKLMPPPALTFEQIRGKLLEVLAETPLSPREAERLSEKWGSEQILHRAACMNLLDNNKIFLNDHLKLEVVKDEA